MTRLGDVGLAGAAMTSALLDLEDVSTFYGDSQALFGMSLTVRAAEVVSLVAGWPTPRIEHWRTLARARAIEDQVVVLACNGVGTHAGVTLGGRSAVVDATGAVLAEASGDREEVLTVDVEVAAVARWREQFPVLRDRRL